MCRPGWPRPASATGSPTERSKGTEPTQADRTLLAAAALAKVKADAQARGSRPAAPAGSNFSKRNDNQGPPAARPAATRPRRDDPAPLDAAISGLISEAGWELAVATGKG